ncbi:MAG: globin [Glaciihabitans sp.]|nr:globin [Glaciihabitans sp.]
MRGRVGSGGRLDLAELHTRKDVMTALAGGPDAAAVGRGITLFVDRLLADDSLSWAFEGVNLDDVRRHSRAFVIAALGGPDLYVGRDMRAAHDGLNLNDGHFDAAVVHLVASLDEVGVASSLTATLPARLEPLRTLIVTMR